MGPVPEWGRPHERDVAGSDRGVPGPAAGRPHARRSSRCTRATRRCVPAPALSARTGCDVYLKVEGANPTGSFKDRGMTVAVSKAVEAGAKAIICASTGNTSASAAAYAARAGHHLRGARTAGQDRARQAGPGAGARRASCCRSAATSTTAWRWPPSSPLDYPVALVNSVNIDRLHGQKTAAFEIVEALGDAPDIHCLPVGNAGNITAYWMGYQEDQAAGNATKTPKMFGFQAAGAAPDRDRQGRSGTVHHRHRHPDRQPGLLDEGGRRPGRLRRADRGGHRPGDPLGVPVAGPRGRRVRRVGQRGQRRRPAAAAPTPAG